MRSMFSSAVLFIWLLIAVQCQVHYVPAHVLVPVINYTAHNQSGTGYGWNVPNHGLPNNSGPWNAPNHGIYNNSKPNYGWNAANHGVHNNSGHGYGWNNGNPRPGYPKNSSVLNTTTAEGNLLVGTIGIYDRLLYTKEYFKSSRWWSSREKVIEYPKDIPSGYLRHETISAIRVYNHLYNADKARAEILAGGVGRQFVKIRLSSNWGNGFKFLVQIYGH